MNRVVETWAEPLARSTAGLTREQLREMLAALRADHLMAASLAGSLEGLRDVLARSMVGESSVATGRVRGKALGDPNADLTYTPVVPCRILDTRIIGGPLQPDVARIFEGYAPFAAQGGASSDCGIPASVPGPGAERADDAIPAPAYQRVQGDSQFGIRRLRPARWCPSGR